MFVPSQFLFNPHDPFTPPDRRMRRCEYLIEHGRSPSPTADDAITWDAWRFFRGLSRCEGEADRKQLECRFPGIAEAYRLTTDELLQRATVEARLLAGEADDIIAAKCAMKPAGVLAYHDLYFGVRPHLTASGYIVAVVLGGKPYKGMSSDDQAMLVKVFGYGWGGHGIDAILDYFRDPPVVPTSLADLDLPALRRLRDRLQVKVAVLALTTPAADLPPATWLHLLQDLATSRHARAADGGKDAVPCAIRTALDAVACLSAVPRSTGGDTAEQAAGGDSPLSIARVGAGDAGRSDRQREPVPA